MLTFLHSTIYTYVKIKKVNIGLESHMHVYLYWVLQSDMLMSPVTCEFTISHLSVVVNTAGSQAVMYVIAFAVEW